MFGQEYAPAGDLFDIIPPQVKQSLSPLPPITVPTLPQLLQSVTEFRCGDFNKPSWDWILVSVPFSLSAFFPCTIPVDALGILSFKVLLRTH